MKNFYEDNASRLLRADRTFYAIFAYLVIFRIDEMTYPVFKDMVLSQDPIKMYNFISYLFNEVNTTDVPLWIANTRFGIKEH